MTDLTERLREVPKGQGHSFPSTYGPDGVPCRTIVPYGNMMHLAADALETLTQENARLREALEPFIKAAEPIVHDDKERWKPDEWIARLNRLNVGQFRALHAASQPAPARKALGGGDEA